MDIDGQSLPDERDLRKLTSQPLSLLILEVLRENADESGRVVCSPTLSAYLLDKLSFKGYRYNSSYGFHYHYANAIAILHKKRLAIRIDKGSGRKPAIYRVDMVTTYEQARELDLQLTRFLCSDITSKLDEITHNTIVSSSHTSVIAGIDARKDQIITEQSTKIEDLQTEIKRLENLLKRTIRRADEFARTTRSDLKNQTPPQP